MRTPSYVFILFQLIVIIMAPDTLSLVVLNAPTEVFSRKSMRRAIILFLMISRKVWLVCVSMGMLGAAVSAYQVPCMPDMLETAR